MVKQASWHDRLWTLGIFGGALLLFGMNLDGLPLRDWDEGIVAQVAREICRYGENNWIYPTLNEQPYLNKPPLVHWLIALSYSIGGVNELTARLPGAMLTAVSVPLLYQIGREIFTQRLAAGLASLVYLTMLPVVRHGRLAMLDGAVLCFLMWLFWCLLRSRRHLPDSLGIGIGIGLICLTKGILGLLLAAIAMMFLIWDTPRLLKTSYFWIGIFLGIAPVASWYLAQLAHYGQIFTDGHVINQSWQRIWSPVEGHTGPPWYYLLEIGKYSWPWLLFLPQSLQLTWENRNLSWGKLVLVWGGGYLLVISVMVTKLPWYVLPFYPALALGIGAYLAQVWYGVINPHAPLVVNPELARSPDPIIYPRAWVIVFSILAIGSWGGSIYFGFFGAKATQDLLMQLAAVGLTMSVAAMLVYRQDRQFIPILIWGSYVSLLLFVNSPHWIWELGEADPVKPIATLIQSATPSQQKIVYTSYPYSRPALNFYSDRQILPLSDAQIQQYWQQDPPGYFLIDPQTQKRLNLQPQLELGTAGDWRLITRLDLQKIPFHH